MDTITELCLPPYFQVNMKAATYLLVLAGEYFPALFLRYFTMHHHYCMEIDKVLVKIIIGAL